MAQDRSLVDRVIMVTGGSRGIGREIALALLEAGSRVAIVASRESAPLDATIATVAAMGAGVRFRSLVGDVRCAQDCARVVEEAARAFGTIEVLFNNAAIAMPISGAAEERPMPFWERNEDMWLRSVETNVNGVFLMTRAVVPRMLERRFGKIINLSTNNRTLARAGGTPYGPSKAFVEAASRAWAADLEGTGVTVNVFLPGGAIDTRPEAPLEPAPGSRFLPVSVVRSCALWLASDGSNGHSAERFVARLWNEDLPLPQRILAAREDGAPEPRIM